MAPSTRARAVSGAFVSCLLTVVLALVVVPAGNIYAYDNKKTHPYIVAEAAKLYEFAELRDFLEQVRQGSTDEDENDVVGSRLGSCVTIEHFWDADKGANSPGLEVASCDKPVRNAWQRASLLWPQIMKEYSAGNKQVAYDRLGRLAHLLADMTVPAHAHMDPHPPFDDDAYEDWMTGEHIKTWGKDTADKAGGLIRFPDNVSETMDRLYYLFYTANQTADYFASDDCDGDEKDPMGWMKYEGWPKRPILKGELKDNDEGDNDGDGDLTRIAEYCFVYAIRATATLFQLFYETVIKPEVKVTVTASSAEIGTPSEIVVQVQRSRVLLKEVKITRPSGAVDTLLSGGPLLGPGGAVTYTYTDANEVGVYKVEVFFDSTSLTKEIERAPLRAPSGLNASAISSSRIDLSWRDNSDSEKGFEIQRRRSGGSFTTIATVSAKTTSYSDTTLSCGTYYYRVRAYNDAGYSDWSNEAYGTTPNCCGNGLCESGENACNCPGDCPGPCCGNGVCDPGENACNCPSDCHGSCCGNGVCEAGENACNCPRDCYGSCCGNGVCEPGENKISCPRDCGGDPPIWGKIMAFPTPERYMGQDLNGDGDMNDTVLRYKNIETGEVVNTGAIVSGLPRAISIYGDVIAFVGERGMIRYYRISTGEIKDVGMAGSTPSLYDNTLVFSSSGRILFFDLTKATLFDPNIQGLSPTIYGNLVAFESGGTIWYYDLVSGITVDTSEVGSSPFIWGDIIAFVAGEKIRGQDLNNDGDELDWIISYYRISTREAVYTGVVGLLPQVYGDVIVFHTYEWAEGKDLNGDGQILGSVIRYWSIADGKVVNTGILGTEPSVYQDTISYYVWEYSVGYDLTGDGDVSDPVVGFFWIGDGVWAHKGSGEE